MSARAEPAGMATMIRHRYQRQDGLDRGHPPGCVCPEDPPVPSTTPELLAFPHVAQVSEVATTKPALAGARDQQNVGGMDPAVSPEPDDVEPIVIVDDDVMDDAALALPVIDPRLLHDVVAYAQARLAAGEGSAALRLTGADHPGLVMAYHLGYLPRSWQEALGTVARRALRGRRLADTLVLPAFDAQGAVVDLLAIHPRAQGGSYVGLQDLPRGLLAAAIATAHKDVTVTDSLRLVARRFAAGHTDALLMRGPADAEANAARLAAAGVERMLVRARVHAEAIATAFRAAGIAVLVVSGHAQSDDVGYDAVPPSPAPTNGGPPVHDEEVRDVCATLLLPDEVPASEPATLLATPQPTADAGVSTSVEPTAPVSVLALVEHDQQSERATFTAGSTTYVVEVPHDEAITRVDVVTRRAGQVHREVVDLAVEAARARYAGNAALRCSVPAAVIAGHLPLLLTEVRKLAAEALAEPDHAALVPAGPERDAALALLRSPDLLDRMAADLDPLGWVGEPEAKRVLLLTAISRKLPEPLWAIRTASSELTGCHGLDLVAALTPPEDLVHVSRLSNAALSYQDANALRHKLLVIDEAGSLTEELITALRILHNRGALSQAIVPRHNLSGSARTKTIEVRGPLAVLSGTSGTMNRWCNSCCLVPVDESSEQTTRVLAAERRRAAYPGGGLGELARAAIIRRHHAAQRLLACRPVVIPFAERIAFPATTLRQRGEQARFIGLVAASALLHQHQRLTDLGHVVADVRDFDLAVSLAEAAGIGAEHDLGRPAVVLLGALRAAGLARFTIDDAHALLPHWGRTSFRSAVADLIREDYVHSPEGGRGQLRSYDLVVPPGQQPARPPAITLHPVTSGSELVSWLPVGQWPTSQLNSASAPEIHAVG